MNYEALGKIEITRRTSFHFAETTFIEFWTIIMSIHGYVRGYRVPKIWKVGT